MDVAIFIIRSLLSLVLYLFLAALFIFLWRDLKAAAHQQPPVLVRERPGRLRVTRGSDGLEKDRIFPLAIFTTIGRAESNTIQVNEPYASAEHAIIAWRNGQWWLEDRGSRNGTLLNDYRVEEPLVVSHGDVIGIGRLQLRFEYAEEPPAADQSST
jgi:hypothetical protein